MGIECLRLKNGYSINQEGFDFEDNAAIMSIVKKYRDQVKILPAGRHDITPSWQRGTNLGHTLIVHEDGTGTYVRELRNTGPEGVGGVVDIMEHPCGIREIRLPQDQSLAVVLGPSNDGRSIAAIYTIVYFSSGKVLRQCL